jgi:molybdopterin synthase catalytic subunit
MTQAPGVSGARGALVARVLDPAVLAGEVAHVGAGAIVSFVGTVRDVHAGRAVTALDYSAYAPMAGRELQAIADEAARRWPPARVAVEHRIGALGLGEASVAIAVAHAHRAPAFAACRWTLEAVKRRVPIWKREHYADGECAWVDARETPALPPADVADEPGLDAC